MKQILDKERIGLPEIFTLIAVIVLYIIKRKIAECDLMLE